MNRFFCLQAKSRRLQIYTVLKAISRLFSAIMQYRSKLNAKTRTQTLYQYLSPLVVRPTRLELVQVSLHAPQTCAYADSATAACFHSEVYYIILMANCQPIFCRPRIAPIPGRRGGLLPLHPGQKRFYCSDVSSRARAAICARLSSLRADRMRTVFSA